MSHYTRFVIKVGVLILFLIIVDYVSGYFLRELYFSQKSGLLYRTTYSIETTQADILIFGSSRANHHYHPDIISDSTKHTYYNVGRDGMGMLYNYALLKSIIKRYKPKLLILDITTDQFKKNNNERERLSALLPYYYNHPELRELLYFRSPFERIKLLSPSYPFNSILPTVLIGNMEINKTRKKDYHGFVPLIKVDSSEIDERTVEESQKNNDELLVHYFEEYIRTCVDNKIKLLVVVSPYFTKNEFKTSLSIKTASSICSKYNISLLDYSRQSKISRDCNLFIDAGHLSEQGSLSFSKVLLANIKNSLSEN